MTAKLTHTRTIKPSEQKALRKRASGQSDTDLHEGVAPSWDRFPGMCDSLPELAAEYITLTQEANRIEARKKEIRDLIEEMHASTEEMYIRGDFFLSEVVISHRPKKLSPEKLLEHGVKMDVIEVCYEGGEEYTYIKVKAID